MKGLTLTIFNSFATAAEGAKKAKQKGKDSTERQFAFVHSEHPPLKKYSCQLRALLEEHTTVFSE